MITEEITADLNTILPKLHQNKIMNNEIQDFNPTSFALEFSLYTLLFYAAFVALARKFLAAKFLAYWRINEAKGLDIACKCVSAGFATAAASFGAYICMAVDHDVDQTAKRRMVDICVDHFLTFAMTYFLYDVYAMYEVYLAKNKPNQASTPPVGSKGDYKDDDSCQDVICATPSSGQKKNFVSFLRDNPLMSAHHLAIALIFIPMMSRVRDHEPGILMIAAALLMEASTPFVTLRSILSDLGLKNSLLYVLNGLVMIAVFFMCRIAVYPLFYRLYAGYRKISYLEALCRGPWHCNIFILLTLLPQLYWFRLMVRGAIKMVVNHQQGPSDKPSTKDNGWIKASNGKSD